MNNCIKNIFTMGFFHKILKAEKNNSFRIVNTIILYFPNRMNDGIVFICIEQQKRNKTVQRFLVL